jgi:hypothetical protein
MTSPPPDEGGNASPTTTITTLPDPFDDPAFDAAAYVNSLFPNGARESERASARERESVWGGAESVSPPVCLALHAPM